MVEPQLVDQMASDALPKVLGGPDAEGAQRAMQASLGMRKIDVTVLRQAYE